MLNFGAAAYSAITNYCAITNYYFSATIGRLTRHTAVPANTSYAVKPVNRLVLLEATKTAGTPFLFNKHVTNGLQFGTDGTLLVASGDGTYLY